MSLPDLKNLSPARQRAWFTGAAWASPTNPVFSQSEWAGLPDSDPRVVEALQHMAWMGESVYRPAVQVIHNREPDKPGGHAAVGDGIEGPAMEILAEAQRCPIPDWVPPDGAEFEYEDPDLQEIVEDMQFQATLPAVSTGNWPSCHGVGDFHCKVTMIDFSGIRAHMREVWPQVMSLWIECDRLIGLRQIVIGADKRNLVTGEEWNGPVNSRVTFVSSSSGWIGLGTVRTGLGCSDDGSWFRILATYNPRNLVADLLTLFVHEDTHTKGFGHFNSQPGRPSKLNPYIETGLPHVWVDSDPATPSVKQRYGGVPVPLDGPPVPGPVPKPGEYRIPGQEFEVETPTGRMTFYLGGIRIR